MRPNWRTLLALVALLAMTAAACAADEADEDTDTDTVEATEPDVDEPDAVEDDDEDEATEPDDDVDDGDDDAEPAGELSGTLVGAGASAQSAALQGWVAGFQTLHPGVTIDYDPVGSGGGRQQFLDGGTDFGGTDSYLNEEEHAQAVERCAGDGGAINLPNYVSPIAIAFNLSDIDEINLTSETIGQIFAGEVTNWSDPAIAEANPDLDLPDLTINAVHRSDDSGTTANFTEYLAAVAPDAWPYEPSGTWPSEAGGEGAAQTSGVIQAIGAGEGSIGYAEASQVGDLGVVAVGVGDEFVPFSPEAAGAALDASERADVGPEGDFSIDLARDTEEPGVYPIVLISYHIICLQYDDQNTADLVKGFMEYINSDEGQQASAESAGSAPLTAELRAEIQTVLDTISVG